MQLIHSLLLKSPWLLEGMVHASGFPAAFLSSISFVQLPSFTQPLLLKFSSGVMLVSSHILWLQGFIHSLSFHHHLCAVTPQFSALHCSLVCSNCWSSHVYLKSSLIAWGLNAPPFLWSLPFLPSSETILHGGEGWCFGIRQIWILTLIDIWSWTYHLIPQTQSLPF